MKYYQVLKSLRFVKGSVDIDVRPVETFRAMQDDGDGKLRAFGPRMPADGRTQRVAHKNDYSVLSIRRDDVPDFISAVQWIIREADKGLINFSLNKFIPGPRSHETMQIQYDKPVNDIEIPGRFIPELSTNCISQLCSDFRLLCPIYRDGQELLKTTFDSWLVDQVFRALIGKVIFQEDIILKEAVQRVLDFKRAMMKLQT